MYYEASLMKFSFGETTEAVTPQHQSDGPGSWKLELSSQKPQIKSPESAEMKNQTW